jgi:hypothetical protein
MFGDDQAVLEGLLGQQAYPERSRPARGSTLFCNPELSSKRKVACG